MTNRLNSLTINKEIETQKVLEKAILANCVLVTFHIISY